MEQLYLIMYRLLIFITFFISWSFSLEEEYILNGYVQDANEKPIYNVELFVKNLSIGTTTDSLGYFTIKLPLDSDYLLSVSHIAYNPKDIKISEIPLLEGVKIYLDKRIININDVVVSALGYSSYIKDTPIITQVITANDIEKSAYISLDEIIQFAIPNVQRVHDPHGTNRLKIQGLDNKFTVFMIDGKRISGEYAGNIDFSLVSLSNIEKIEFVKSGMSTLYGSDAMGGIINIITKKYTKPIHASISYVYNLPTIQSANFDFGFRYGFFNYKLHLDYNNSPGYDLTDFSPLSKTSEENAYGQVTNSFYYMSERLQIDYTNKYYAKKVNRYNSIFNTTTLEYDTTLYQQNPRYFDYLNTLNVHYLINENVDFNFQVTNDLYNKSYYFPYYYSRYPDFQGEIKTSALPVRFDCVSSIKYIQNNHIV